MPAEPIPLNAVAKAIGSLTAYLDGITSIRIRVVSPAPQGPLRTELANLGLADALSGSAAVSSGSTSNDTSCSPMPRPRNVSEAALRSSAAVRRGAPTGPRCVGEPHRRGVGARSPRSWQATIPDEPPDPEVCDPRRASRCRRHGQAWREAPSGSASPVRPPRTTLKRVFNKVGVSRQSERVSMLTKLVLR